MNRERGNNGLFVCPCCGYATLSESSAWEICEICLWEDDGQDDPKADEDWGGPNSISLTEGRRNYLLYGVNDKNEKEFAREANSKDERVRCYTLAGEKVVISNAP